MKHEINFEKLNIPNSAIFSSLYEHKFSDEIKTDLCRLSDASSVNSESLDLEAIKKYLELGRKKTYELEDYFDLNLSDSTLSTTESSKITIVGDELSSSSSSQRKLNEDLMQKFNLQSHKFLYLLHHVTFEDGCENEATDFFQEMLAADASIALLWLHGFYAEHQDDHEAVEGILRILSMIDIPEYQKYVLTLVKASFNANDSAVQEAAIMIAENWRNEMCLKALETTVFANEWIKTYASKVKKELKEELGV